MAAGGAKRMVVAVKRRLLPARDAAVWLRDKLRGVRRIHYLHIGKTGGTAVKTALREASGGGTRFVLHPHETSLADIPRGEGCIFFVRDPISRFISGFFSRQRQGRPRYNNPWTPDEARAFAAFETPNALGLALGSDDAERRAQALHAMRTILHVRNSYWEWLKDEDCVRRRRDDILFVGTQEHLERDVAELSRTVGVELRLPADDVASHRMPSQFDTKKELDEEAFANLVDWYRADYDGLALLRDLFAHLPDYRSAALGRVGAKAPAA